MDLIAAGENIRLKARSSARLDPEGIEIDISAERRLVKKLDLYIIPIVMLLYLFSFLDR